jgi:hypothetical protein
VRGGKCIDDECAGLICESPPARYCSDDGLFLYDTRGTCKKGVCTYAGQTVPCARGCEDGRCIEFNACYEVRCNEPPASFCVDDTLLRHYVWPGRCDGGACIYDYEEVECEQGCLEGQCVEELCEGIPCRRAPANHCLDENILLVANALTGTCAAGFCDYDTKEIVCENGCENGRCIDEPCAGINCDLPPAQYCDGQIEVSFSTTGTCESGICVYEETRRKCAGGCSAGLCLEEDDSETEDTFPIDTIGTVSLDTDTDETTETDECALDADSDGTVDCQEDCDNDPSKTEPGYCGCGQPETCPDAWLFPSHTYRRQITFNNSSRGETFVNMPVAILLDDSRIRFDGCKPDGSDIRFVDGETGENLSYEIDAWEASSGVLWVKVPDIDASTNTDAIWMYYGNKSALAGDNPADVWSDNYEFVYHFEGDANDSTSNGFDCESNTTLDAPGKIGRSRQHQGESDTLRIGRDIPLVRNASAVTACMWLTTEVDGTTQELLGISNYESNWTSRVYMSRESSAALAFGGRAPDVGTAGEAKGGTIPSGSWQFLCGTVNFAEKRAQAFVNGASVATSTNLPFTKSATDDVNSASAAIGSEDRGWGEKSVVGSIDEVHLSTVERSPAWINAQYASMTDAFAVFGPELTQ